MGEALKYISERGVTYLDKYKYIANSQPCLINDWDEVFKIKGYRQVRTDDQDQLVAAISNLPVSVGIGANNIRLYKNGVYNNWDCAGGINHGVVAVGFGNENGQYFWKVKNSWGTGWGEDGYIRMERKLGYGQGICEITQQARYPY